MRLPHFALVCITGLAFSTNTSVCSLQAQTNSKVDGKPKFESKVVTRATPGQSVKVELDLKGAKSLYLVVQDGGDGFGCDWAAWVEPKLIGEKGETKLTELKWKSAVSGFGKVAVNGNCQGEPLKVAGQTPGFGIGTHANSIIEYELPEAGGFTKFTAQGALDDSGLNQGCGSTIQFLVFTEKPDAKYLVASAAGAPAAVGSRDPKDAIGGLDVAEGLEANLFASEASGMLSPSDIDVDHLGRVWVCEVVNYRHRNGERKEGDRILVIEDTNGDGVSDQQTVFFQGHEVDSALGIGVFPTPSGKGTRVIVSCAPNVWVFTDEDGDLKADKKELLFTKVGDPQHDHSTHAFIFGPDGKLYWNVGNTGHRVFDKDGKAVIDLAGNEVNDSGKPYRQGMAFRCNLDGTEFEVLGNNFRNNYELTVDSFGTVWQSDNDDDGNKGVRINYVMEGGNFGYVDEITGAGWQTPRTNLEAEIPLRHWHLNDPGVVPNLIQTGAGSPTGICFYEGTLLPEIFRNQVIHCDAGPNVVRAYPAKKFGAGYTAEIANILTGARDNWFRPSDVCVAPDGSLIIADWYDPGVGGHRMGDADKGRLFRVAPPGTPYKQPKIDVSTVEGAIAALKSPNLVARYLGWTALHDMGEKAEAALSQVFEKDPNIRHRARALWVLGKTSANPEKYIDQAFKERTSETADLRIAAIRLARQSKMDLIPLLRSVAGECSRSCDGSPEVRREAALALRYSKSPRAPEIWANLAVRANLFVPKGSERWFLEALGIGADKQWDAFLDAYLKLVGEDWNQPSSRDIIWRSRATKSPGLLAKIIADSSVTAEECPRYLRAFDFLSGTEKQDALITLAFGSFGDEAKTRFVNSEAIGRLKGFDVTKNKEHMHALNRVLDGLKGQPQFVTLIDRFNVEHRYGELAELAASRPDDQIGIDAVRVLLAKQQQQLLNVMLTSKKDDGRPALGLATALSNSGEGAASELLLPFVKDAETPADFRRQSIKGATRTKAGAIEVLKLAEAKAFDESYAPALSAALQGAPLDAGQLETVAKLFPSPAGKDAKPLPSLAELAQRKGNAGVGLKVFATTGKCASCHIVAGQGKEVGPNLSEIGSKLSRQALFESIIFPSAGISHNYETFTAALKDGTVVNGILVSQTEESITLRNNEAITKAIPRADIDDLVKQKLSIMPADLAKLLSLEELIDVVEYLATLKKK